MPLTFIGSAVTNFRAGRPAGFRPEAIVLHRTGGSREFWRSRFNTAGSTISAHYVVGRDGTVDMYVLETDTAFHAGMVVGPTWRGLRPTREPELLHHRDRAEGRGGGRLARPADCTRRPPWWPKWPHAGSSVSTATMSFRTAPFARPAAVPGATCPIGRILDLARGTAMLPRPPREKVVRTLSRANLRRASPSQQAPVVRVIAADTQVIVQGFVDAGERGAGQLVLVLGRRGRLPVGRGDRRARTDRRGWHGDGHGRGLGDHRSDGDREARVIASGTGLGSAALDAGRDQWTAGGPHEVRAGAEGVRRRRPAQGSGGAALHRRHHRQECLRYLAHRSAASGHGLHRRSSTARSTRCFRRSSGRRTWASRAPTISTTSDRSASRSPTSGRCSDRPRIRRC